MTREQWKELLPVITAWTNGAIIGHRNNPADPWEMYPANESPAWAAGEWKIWEIPREWWVRIGGSGMQRLYETQKEADNHAVTYGGMVKRVVPMERGFPG